MGYVTIAFFVLAIATSLLATVVIWWYRRPEVSNDAIMIMGWRAYTYDGFCEYLREPGPRIAYAAQYAGILTLIAFALSGVAWATLGRL